MHHQKPHPIGRKQAATLYDGGRQTMMEATVAHKPFVNGRRLLGRYRGAYAARKGGQKPLTCRPTALTGRSHSVRIEQSALRSADFVHKAGHIGLYVGGGYAVEWMGGAYGCPS